MRVVVLHVSVPYRNACVIRKRAGNPRSLCVPQCCTHVLSMFQDLGLVYASHRTVMRTHFLRLRAWLLWGGWRHIVGSRITLQAGLLYWTLLGRGLVGAHWWVALLECLAVELSWGGLLESLAERPCWRALLNGLPCGALLKGVAGALLVRLAGLARGLVREPCWRALVGGLLGCFCWRLTLTLGELVGKYIRFLGVVRIALRCITT